MNRKRILLTYPPWCDAGILPPPLHSLLLPPDLLLPLSTWKFDGQSPSRPSLSYLHSKWLRGFALPTWCSPTNFATYGSCRWVTPFLRRFLTARVRLLLTLRISPRLWPGHTQGNACDKSAADVWVHERNTPRRCLVQFLHRRDTPAARYPDATCHQPSPPSGRHVPPAVSSLRTPRRYSSQPTGSRPRRYTRSCPFRVFIYFLLCLSAHSPPPGPG